MAYTSHDPCGQCQSCGPDITTSIQPSEHKQRSMTSVGRSHDQRRSPYPAPWHHRQHAAVWARSPLTGYVTTRALLIGCTMSTPNEVSHVEEGILGQNRLKEGLRGPTEARMTSAVHAKNSYFKSTAALGKRINEKAQSSSFIFFLHNPDIVSCKREK